MIRVMHHDDADGRASAAILKRRFTNQNMTFQACNYDREPCIDDVKVGDTCYIVDFSFHPRIMSALRLRTEQIVWIDHHRSAKDLEASYGVQLNGLREFDKKIAGCELTWRYLYGELPAPRAVQLVGDYDSWRLEDPDSEALMLGLDADPRSVDPDSDLWAGLMGDDAELQGLIDTGRACLGFRDQLMKQYRETYGFEIEFEGYPCFVNGFYRFGSKAFGPLLDQYPVCMSYVFNGKLWTIGLYSTKIDVSELAKRHGGGGHRGAAGFTCTIPPWQGA